MEKLGQVLQPHIESLATNDRSHLVESAASLRASPALRSHVGACVVDFTVAAVYSLLDWCGSNWFIWLIWFVLFIWLVLSNQKTRQTKQTK